MTPESNLSFLKMYTLPNLTIGTLRWRDGGMVGWPGWKEEQQGAQAKEQPTPRVQMIHANVICDKGCDKAEAADVNHNKRCAQDNVANNVADAEVHSLCLKKSTRITIVCHIVWNTTPQLI